MEKKEALMHLVGEEVNAICFVMDYVEVHFNGIVLTCYSPPIVQCLEGEFVFPGPGSRDALCALIGDVPGKASEIINHSIVLTMNSGCTLGIRTDRESTKGREAALLIGIDETTFVW
jgi:hypothetical protein